MRLRLLTWNLMHGRARPPAGRELLAEFTSALERWEWDVALLQEVPPWWAPALATGLGAEQRLVLTSRNALLPLRQAVAIRRPDLIKSNGGGANAILARRDRVVAHEVQRLCRWPERRWAHAVRLACGVWIANVHATAGSTAAAERDARLTAACTRIWAGAEPLAVGGDFNLRSPDLEGLARVGGHDVDHVFVGPGWRADGGVDVLDRGVLSDHAPVAATLVRAD